MNLRKRTVFSAILLAMTMLLSFSACGNDKEVSMESIYKANTTSELMKNYDSVCGDFTYYENLKDSEKTFFTSYRYSDSGAIDDGPVYSARGKDILNPDSNDNFIYCVVDDVEYFMESGKDITIYPLIPSYMDELEKGSITMHDVKSEKIESAKRVDDIVEVTTTARIGEVYAGETISHLESLCGDKLDSILTVYSVDSETLILQSVKTDIVSESGTQYPFSEEKVSYNNNEPETQFAEKYIKDKRRRNVTIKEKTDDGKENSCIYSVYAGKPVSFKSFTDDSYVIYTDAGLTKPFSKDVPGETGFYEDLILYASKAQNGALKADENTSAKGSE